MKIELDLGRMFLDDYGRETARDVLIASLETAVTHYSDRGHYVCAGTADTLRHSIAKQLGVKT